MGQLHIFFSQRVTEEGKTRPSAANGFYGFWFGVAGVWGNLLGFFYFNPDNLPSTEFTDADGKAGYGMLLRSSFTNASLIPITFYQFIESPSGLSFQSHSVISEFQK